MPRPMKESSRRSSCLFRKNWFVLMGELAVADKDRERYLKDGYEVVTAAMVDRLTDVVNDLEKNHHVDFKHWATPGT